MSEPEPARESQHLSAGILDSPVGERCAIFEAAPDGIVVVDSQGVIRDANPQAEEMFGYTREELVGSEVEVLVPEDSRGIHREERTDYVEDPEPRPMGVDLELRGLRKDGTEFPVEISLSPLHTDEGMYVISIVRDVSERRRLREFGSGSLRAAEEERKRIARELHDDAAQRLATLLVRTRIALKKEDGDYRQVLEEMRGEILEAAEGVRRIARGLRPPALQDVGVVAAIRSHLRQTAEATELGLEFDADPVDALLDEDGKLVLYRVVQEAVNNVVRHAEASGVTVSIARGEGGVRGVVEDDGKGFDLERAVRDGRGLGIMGMQERASSVGGKLSIDSRRGEGTRVVVELPVAAGRLTADQEAV